MAAPGFDEASKLYLTGQFYTCLEACERILAEHPQDPSTLHLVGMLCYRGGDVRAASAWFRRCLETDPNNAEALIDLALMLKKEGQTEEAVEMYKRGLELDPKNAQAHCNLGVALRELNRNEEAVASFKTAVALNPFVVGGFNALGQAEAELDHFDEAVDAFRKSIAIAPEAKQPYHNLADVARRMGRLDIALESLRWGVGVHGNKVMGASLALVMEEDGDVDGAVKLLERTVTEDPQNADAWETLANMHFKQHRFAEALDALCKCVAIDPARAEVHMRIHTMAQIVGQRDLALEHQRKALEVTRLFTERGADGLRPHLLILKAAGDWQANLPTDFIIRRDDWGAVYHYFVSPDGPPPPEDIPFSDAVFNAVAEPDLTRGELATSHKIIDSLHLPTLNFPDRVAKTGRADVAAALADVPHMQIPASLRLPTSGAAAALDAALAEGRIGFPMILRPTGTHAGQGVHLVEDRAAATPVLEASAGGEVYATQYVDYRNEDGLFRKYRVIVVDGTPYPFHMAVSKRWLVHYYNAVNDDAAAMDREEEHFLAEFENVFSPSLREAFAEMARRLGLDFFGVDCSIAPDGRLLLFEVDVGVIVHVMDDPVRHAYKHKYVPRIFEAVRKMIENRISAQMALAAH
ncbi:MAG TPA: tetratricopeptide repeat protein [Magnetospirillaceae bacterium]|jgi:tetratricopeptide (TPR) repeat protein